MVEAEDTRVAAGTNEARRLRQGSHGTVRRARASAAATAGEASNAPNFRSRDTSSKRIAFERSLIRVLSPPEQAEPGGGVAAAGRSTDLDPETEGGGVHGHGRDAGSGVARRESTFGAP